MAGTPKSRWDPRKLLGTPRSQWEPHEASRDPGELSGTPGSRRDPGKPRAPPAPGATACLPQHHRGGAGLHRQPHPLRRHLHRRRLGVPAPCRPPARCRPALHLLPPLHEHRRWGGLPPSLAWGRGTWRLGFAADRGRDEGGSVGQGPPREGQPRSPPPLQSRWAGSCSGRPSPPTSRSGWTSPAHSSGRTGGWCPMPPTSLSTWVPCRRLSSSR